MRVTFWNPKLADVDVIPSAMLRLELAGNILADRTRQNLRALIRRPGMVGRYALNRPVYRRGKYAGRSWTARQAGDLLASVRVVKHYSSNIRNIWVMVGNKKVYYGLPFEYATRPAYGRPFFRPAIESSRALMKSVIEGGV